MGEATSGKRDGGAARRGTGEGGTGGEDRDPDMGLIRLAQPHEVAIFRKGSLRYGALLLDRGRDARGPWLEVSTMAALGEGDRCRLADSTGAQFGAVATEVRPSGDPTERLARLLTDGIPLPAATSMGRAGAEVARRLAARLDAEGCRSDDENGMGFKMDVDAYIGFRPRCFDVVDHRRPYDPDAIIRHCRIAEGVTVAAARRRMEEIWMDLRYPSFEEHAFEDADDGFAFHFLTMVPPDLGVTGWIECRVE